MEIEHSIHCFPIDADLQGKVNELVKEGWDLTPGIPPVAVYHLVRAKKPAVVEEPSPGLPMAFKMLIDESLVGVYGPDGKPK